MHELAQVVEILVQILQNSPLWNCKTREPPPPLPPNENLADLGSLAKKLVQSTPPPPRTPDNENLAYLDRLAKIGPEYQHPLLHHHCKICRIVRMWRLIIYPLWIPLVK